MSDILNELNDFLGYLFSWPGLWVWLLTIVALGMLLYIRPHPFWLTDLIYRFPLIGKLARYSQDHSERVPGSWLNVELTLCGDYARHATSMSRADFDNHIEYLRKAHDLGRRPLPLWAFALIALLVAFEGLAFAYILGSWISIDSSENERILFMLAIVVVLAIVLVIITHKAGHQLYRTKLLQSCFRAWKEKREKHFFTRMVSLSEDQSKDDNESPYVQCTNRVVTRHGDYGSYVWVLVAVFFIAVIAIGATVLRLETLDTSRDAELLANVFGEMGDAAAGAGGQTDSTAAFVSFAILAVIFVVTQFVAMGFGYNYGFAGRESVEAFNETGGHSNYRSYWRRIQHRMNIADLRLQTLQRLLEQRSGPIDWHTNFFDYVREQRAAGNSNLHEPPPDSPDRPTDPVNQAKPAAEPPADPANVTPFDRTAK